MVIDETNILTHCFSQIHRFEVKIISAPNFTLQLLMCYFIPN